MARSATEIQAEIDETSAAISAALKAQSYSLDTGQGRQQVTRVNLTELKKHRQSLELELANANADANGHGGLDRIDFQRGAC